MQKGGRVGLGRNGALHHATCTMGRHALVLPATPRWFYPVTVVAVLLTTALLLRRR